jgi:hypothetical protein
MKRQMIFLSLFFSLIFGEDANVPLNLFPLIMAHDAGSGYLKSFDRDSGLRREPTAQLQPLVT